jgi:2-dehydro-3-deoxygluconokinase
MTTGGHVLLFGELLLGLRPPGVERLAQADTLGVRFSGAEANAGVSLVNYGHRAVVVSRVPGNPIGAACLGYLRRFGLDTSGVGLGGERLGIYYVETGAAQRASTVVYDRAGSAFATSSAADYAWPALLEGAAWLHFSGTAPALGEGVVDALLTGVRLARERGIPVSCDLNYRARLWSPERAQQVMSRLMPYVDVLIGNEEDAEKVFGIRAAGSDVVAGRIIHDSYVAVARQLVDRFGFRRVATTLRESLSASHNRWAGLLVEDGRAYLSRQYDITPVVDRLGAGDSFSGALIHGLLERWDPQRAVEFAAAASCLKHSVVGDLNLVSTGEVEALLAGDASGRVRR